MRQKSVILFLIAISIASTCYAENIYTFKVNDKPYYFTEPELDKQFGAMFDKIIESRTSKSKHFSLWRDSYERWKKVIKVCSLEWKLYGSHASSIKSNCPDGRFDLEDKGRDKDGNTAKGSPNDPLNHARRVAFLNGMFTEYLSNAISQGKI